MPLIALEVDHAAAEKLREHEIEEARTLQRAMVPVAPLQASPVEIANQFRPATQIGGDFLDYFVLTDHTLGLYLGDVVGKGLPAALYAALVVGTLHGIHKTGESPAHVLRLLNKRLRMRGMPGRYCAVQYAVFDPETRLLRYANAGLPGPLHLSARGCRELREGGLPAGMFDDPRYEPQCVLLEPGDAVLFLSDGLTEAVNADREEFGADRLVKTCEENRNASAPAMLDRIFAAVDAFAAGQPQYDDMAAAALKFGPWGARGGAPSDAGAALRQRLPEAAQPSRRAMGFSSKVSLWSPLSPQCRI
jgi:sigma-B regulation protein RsbU (phosphoserine phosphatase)